MAFLFPASSCPFPAEETHVHHQAAAGPSIEFNPKNGNGKDKTLARISNNKGQFVDRDLYISVYDMKGTVLAHGTNAKLIGKDVSALKDADGKEFIKDIIGKTKAAGKGTSDYKWPNPVSKEIQAKTVYFEKPDDMVFSSGYYK